MYQILRRLLVKSDLCHFVFLSGVFLFFIFIVMSWKISIFATIFFDTVYRTNIISTIVDTYRKV